MFGGRNSTYLKIAALHCALSAMTGCGLIARSGAINPNAAVVQAFASSLELGTNLQRSSGEALLLRLQALFPGINPTNQLTGSADLDPTQYAPLTATGLNGPVADMNRPFTALTQMAMRSKTAQLCQTYTATAPTSNPVNSIFDPSVLQGNVPSDTATALALTVVRNAWLDIYQATDPEVVAMAQLYQGVLALANAAGGATQTTSVAAAQEAICEAALSAPQFWLGNATSSDALRRASLEIGHRIPAMSDLQAFAAGTLSLKDYVSHLQFDSDKQPGYLAAVQSWMQIGSPMPTDPNSELVSPTGQILNEASILPTVLAAYGFTAPARQLTSSGVIPAILKAG